MEHEIERLDKYLLMKGINDNEFTVNTGISQGWIGKARRDKFSITDKTRKKILKEYKDLNPVWLQTGSGDMLLKTISFDKMTITHIDNGNGEKLNNDQTIEDILRLRVKQLEEEKSKLEEDKSKAEEQNSKLTGVISELVKKL